MWMDLNQMLHRSQYTFRALQSLKFHALSLVHDPWQYEFVFPILLSIPLSVRTPLDGKIGYEIESPNTLSKA